jgi:thiol-disulfide isomerase/thioredoxin
MKYLIPLIVVALVALSGYATFLFLPDEFDACCEYLGLLAPDGVSETPGVEHITFDEATPDGSIPADMPGLKLHENPGTFTLPDIHGETHNIDLAAGKPTVVVWVSSFCPTSKIYEARMNQLAKDFPGVRFVAINSSAMEGLPELVTHFTREDPDRLTWTVLKDDRNVIADRFGARVTTEAFVFDGQGRLQYRGGIDDARIPTRVAVQYVRVVLGQLENGREPEWRYQPAKGCCPIDKLGAPEPKTP